jgi:hypothetical protein
MSQPDRYSEHVVNELFGDSLPSTTRDERPDGSPEEEADRDAWLRDNVPPHHA